MQHLQIVYKAHNVKLVQKFLKHSEHDIKSGKHLKITINLLNFDAKFFYALVHFANRSIAFQNGVLELVLQIISTYSTRSVDQINLDFKTFKKFLYSDTNILTKFNVSSVVLKAVDLVQHDEIIRAWYIFI